MANLKRIRKRIASVKNTQKITRAMKMVAGARLSRAQQRILALRPYAIKTHQVLAEVTLAPAREAGAESELSGVLEDLAREVPLLVRRPVRRRLLLVITSDRGLCGAFNTNIGKAAIRAWQEAETREPRQTVQMAVIGRKGREYLRRRGAPLSHVFSGVWERLGLEVTREIAHVLLRPFATGEVDSIELVYNEFKSAMSQRVVLEQLLPVPGRLTATEQEQLAHSGPSRDFIFEPGRKQLLERLVPMYLEITILRALYESQASEFGARMTAMDAATKNAKEMIDRLTLQYNRARQAAITTELMEIIGGANALQG